MVKNANLTLLLTSSGQECQFHIATVIYQSRLTISHCYWHCYWNFNHEASYLPDVICNIVVQAHFGRSSLQMQCSPCQIYPLNLSDEVTKMRCEMKYPNKQSVIPPNLSDEVTKIRCEMKYPERLSVIPPSPNIEFSGLAISHCYWYLVVKNDNFTLLLTSSCQEWQLHIATDIYWSKMAISNCYWHLVVKHGNITLLLSSSGQEWQFHTATNIKWWRMAISHCYWHLVFKNGNCTLLLTSSSQE